ncbi:MAG: XdhC family protein, partial [Ignavibacteriales bacterium]|nr:XdhC family protein [Ignavibacteriales bacterium]
MENIKFWNLILDELKNNNDVILLIVAESEGYTPGSVGFKMILTESGKTFGTIGGGQLEFDLIGKAKHLLKQNNSEPFLEHHSLDNEIHEGMICGGNQTIIFYSFKQSQITNVEKIISIYQSHKQGVIEINSDNNISVIPTIKMSFNSPLFFYDNENKWEYVEPIGIEPIIHIIGGGHVSLALSQILAMLNYYTIVYDERNDVDTFVNNNYAGEKKCVAFEKVHEHIKETERTYIIIMTPGHKSDEIVLRNTINKNVKYI